jgi:hypothetical protein
MQPTTRTEREALRKAAGERRDARRLWRREMLARVAGGESPTAVAGQQGVSVRTLQRALKFAASERPRGNGRPDAALQLERLRRALRLADARIAQGDINGVYALSKLMPLAMRYEKIARDASDAREAAPSPATRFS